MGCPHFIDTCNACIIQAYEVTHNWTKGSIFWDLLYWKYNLLCHNLVVMHIENNFFDNAFNTLMDVKDKRKDNEKAKKTCKFGVIKE